MAYRSYLESQKVRRAIRAEDPDWSLSLVPSLSSICLDWIVKNFEMKPIFDELPPNQKTFVMERIPTSLPLDVTVEIIPDGVYWKRCCKQRWGLCEVSQYGDSWKRMFFERHLEHIIEAFIPDVTEKETILSIVSLCKSYIKRLDISQLLLPLKEHRVENEAEESGSDISFEFDYEFDEPPQMDHFDFNIILDKLINLEELHLIYRVRDCGMNFEWNMFEMTEKDCRSLATALKSCTTLKLFNLHESLVNDKKCRLLVKSLLDHPSLTELNFSHNQIGDKGARALAKLLKSNRLQVLNMSHNQLTGAGAKAIAHALSSNSSLLALNLRFNSVRDEGGQAICIALLSNKTLTSLNLSGNHLTLFTAFAVSKLLDDNKTLKRINLSSNKLGESGGNALAEAMSRNSTIIECDVRLTEMGEKSADAINMVVMANKSLEPKGKKQHSRKVDI